jgi:hypothetical protein
MATVLSENDMFFTAFQPKQSHLFIMYMDGIPSYMVKAVSRPTINQPEKTIPYINLERYIKGKSTWQPMTITMQDPVVPSGAQAVMEWIRLGHESVTGRDGYADFYKKDLVFNSLGPVGDKIEEFILKGAFITSANFGKMDYESDNIVNIELTLRYDFAILNY